MKTQNRAQTQKLPPIGFLIDLEDDARERLANMGHFISRPEGAYLSIQGRAHQAMVLILHGEISINIHAHGDRIQLGILSAGDLVGEMSVIDPRVASSTAKIINAPARLWVIEQAAFDQFITDDPSSGLILLKALGKVLCKRIRTDSELMLRKAEQMRAHFLDIDY